MEQTLAGLRIDTPQDWSPDEVMMSFRAPPSDLKSPMVLNKQLVVRPNLIVHRRPVDAKSAPSIEIVCGEVCAELVSSIPGMENLTTGRFEFQDGASGMLAAFDFPAGNDARVRQFQAMRLDGGMLTTLTLSIDATLLTAELTASYLRTLASATPAGAS